MRVFFFGEYFILAHQLIVYFKFKGNIIFFFNYNNKNGNLVKKNLFLLLFFLPKSFNNKILTSFVLTAALKRTLEVCIFVYVNFNLKDGGCCCWIYEVRYIRDIC